MNLEENVKKVRAFLPPEKEKIALSNGEEFEYTLRVGMGRSMQARSKLASLLKHCGIKYEDLFGSDVGFKEGETDEEFGKRYEENEKKKRESQSMLQGKLREPDETFQKIVVEMLSIILNQKEEWVIENVEEEDILGIVVPFFLMKAKKQTMGWYKTLARMKLEKTKMDEEEMELMSKLVTENTLPGVLEKTEEIPPLQKSQDSLKQSAQVKS